MIFLNSLKKLDIETLSNLSESKVNKIFIQSRWKERKFISCPSCGSFKKYNIKDKQGNFKRFKCKDCKKSYSITTGTIFENHKLPLKKYLLSIFLFVNSVKGISSLQLSRDLNLSSKISFVILHKIRTSLFNQYEELNKNKLKGEIQMDGAYINYLPKKENKKKDRKDRRELKHERQECIITMREVNDIEEDSNQYNRTYAFIIKNENKEDIERLIHKYIEPNSTIITDEHVSYKGIGTISNIDGDKIFNHLTVNHSVEYQTDDGINTNFAESYFSRLRRMEIGVHHSMSKKYLPLYVNEITYRENMRMFKNRFVFIDLLKHCMNCPPTTNFNGYFQRSNSDINDFRNFDLYDD